MSFDVAQSLWNALARAEQEVFGDHLSFGTVRPLIESALRDARLLCDGSCDIALARRQVGPDGVVPGNARECAELWEREASRLRQQRNELLSALKGVIRVTDRKTDEFDAARAAIAKAEGPIPSPVAGAK